jgi:hypothetical protein
VRLDPKLVAIVNEGETTDRGGGDQLDGQDGVNFADELVADLDGSLGDRTSELDEVEAGSAVCSTQRWRWR